MSRHLRKCKTDRLLLGAWSAVALLGSCQPSSAPPMTEEPLYVAGMDLSTPIRSDFHLVVDPAHAALMTTHREPQEGPAQVTAKQTGNLEVVARAKTLPARSDRIWVDLYVVNHADHGVAQLKLAVTGGSAFDVNEDPLGDLAVTQPLVLGGVASHGVTHVAITVPATAKSELELALSGVATQRSASNSAPIVTTPDGRQVWSVVPDANVLVAIDTATDQRIATVAIPGRPSSVAVTPDGARLLVTSADANTVTVVDPATHAVVQTLSESDGLGRDLRHIVVSPDGASAYASAYVGDSVTQLLRLQSGRYKVAGHVSTGRRPLGLAVAADGSTVLVSHYLPRGTPDDNETWMSVIQTQPLKLHHEVIWRDLGNRNEATCLGQKYGQPTEKMQLEGTATQLAGVFLPPNGALAWIPGLRIGPSAIWELGPGKSLPGISQSTVSPGFLFFADSRGLEKTAVKRQPLVLDLPDAKLDFLRCAKLDYDSESPRRKLVDMEPGAQQNDGAAIPTGITGLSEAGTSRFIAFSRGGRRALLLSYAADEVQVYDAATQHPASVAHFQLTGSNPTGLAVSPDGKRGYVSYENSLFVSVLDLTAYADPEKLPAATFVPFEYRMIGRASNSLVTESRLVRLISQVPAVPPISESKQIALLDADVLSTKQRRGRVLFSSSNPVKYPALTASRQASCGTCHPSGGHDGSVWVTTEGVRRTLNLRGGVAGRGWLHQMGTHQNISEFVKTVVPERLLGKGLSEEDYGALAEYIAFQIPRLQSPPTDAVAAARGKALFAQSCTGCHSGDKATGGNPDPADPLGGGLAAGPALYDVGTATSDAHIAIPSFFTSRLPPPASTLYELIRGDRALGDSDPVQMTLGFRARPNRSATAFRAPALVNVWDYSVFFHSGAVSSLRGSVEFLNTQLKLKLTPEQISDLVEYLKTL